MFADRPDARFADLVPGRVVLVAGHHLRRRCGHQSCVAAGGDQRLQQLQPGERLCELFFKLFFLI